MSAAARLPGVRKEDCSENSVSPYPLLRAPSRFGAKSAQVLVHFLFVFLFRAFEEPGTLRQVIICNVPGVRTLLLGLLHAHLIEIMFL